MNVLFIHYPFFGGPQDQALRLAGPLAARGVATSVVPPDEPGNAAEHLCAAGLEVVPLPLHRLRAIPDPLTASLCGRAIGLEDADRDLGVLIGT